VFPFSFGDTLMQPYTKDELIEQYREAYDAIPQAALELDLTITARTMQALAEGQPVSPAQLADLWEMPLDQVRAILEQANARGRVEIDDRGNLIGAILSLNPTTHQVTIADRRLYAWCAFDALYAPGVVGKPAQIVSVDPVTDETIRVSMTSDGVDNVQPESAVVTVVGAGADMRSGPESARCTQMLFFGSRETAERWQRDHAGVSILTVDEVYEIAEKFQIEPARRLGLVR
jgi:alkylmercury lyase